jgi:hypothetical protein
VRGTSTSDPAATPLFDGRKTSMAEQLPVAFWSLIFNVDEQILSLPD